MNNRAGNILRKTGRLFQMETHGLVFARMLFFLWVCLVPSCQREQLVSPEADTIPPLPPASIRVEAAHDGYIFVGWLKNKEADFKTYVVFRAESSKTNPFAAVDTTTNNYFIDLNRSYDTTYYYFVTAIDNTGNQSAPSDTVGAKAPNLYDPDPTSSLFVHGRNDGGVRFFRVEWNIIVDGDVEGYEIYRSLSSPVEIKTGNKISFTNATMFDDSTANKVAEFYYYSIVTVDRGKRSSIASVTDGDFITDPPILTSPGHNALVLDAPVFEWKRVPRAVHYRVSVSIAPGESELWSSIVNQSSNDTILLYYDGTPLDIGRTYYWKISTLTKDNGTPNATSEFRLFQIVH